MAEREYIERESFLKLLSREVLHKRNYREDEEARGIIIAMKSVKRFPAADVAPVVHGEWMPSPDGINPIKCRRCGTVAPYRLESDSNHDIGLYPYKSNYCPNCGAKMYRGTDNG